MKTLPTLIAVAIASLVLVAPAAAITQPHHPSLRLEGYVQPHFRAWAAEAQASVPLPDAALTIEFGEPAYWGPEQSGGTAGITLPGVGPRWPTWTWHAQHEEFVHELGHAFDRANMSLANRNSFRHLVGTPCGWWSRDCYTRSWANDELIHLSPGEMFAEAYAACALGLTFAERDAEGYPSYGFEPPLHNDAALCDLIRAMPSTALPR